MAVNWKQVYAIKERCKKQILKVNPGVTDQSGIYFLTREEDGFKYAYIGQAKHLLSRLAEHLTGYQHIDMSLKKHGLYNDDNVTGWKVNVICYPLEELDSKEQYWIKQYANKGYQLRNKTSGSQGTGKSKIDEYKPSKGYRDGLDQGKKNASRDISHLFDLHLEVRTKKEPPTKNQEKALQKFNEFLNYYKVVKTNED